MEDAKICSRGSKRPGDNCIDSNLINRENEKKAKLVLAVATKEQMRVLDDFQSGTEFLFLMNLRKRPITKESIDDTLQIMVNTVEGDVSQLEEEHVKYAKKKGWLKGFELEDHDI